MKNNTFNLLFLVLFTIIINLLNVVNLGVFWDDWTLFNMSDQGIKDQFIGNGGFYGGSYHIHSFLNSLPNPVLSYRIVSLILTISSALLFHKILIISKLFTPKNSFFIALIFIALPYNLARITMICLPYTVSLFIFLLACFMYFKSDLIKSDLYRYLSLPLFYFSFFTNSLLLLYSLILLHILIKNNPLFDFKKWMIMLKTNFLFFSIPVLFWFIRQKYFHPIKLYSEYNEIKLSNIIALPIDIFKSINANIIGIMQLLFEHPYSWLVIMVIFLAILIFSSSFKKMQVVKSISFDSIKKEWFWLSLLMITLSLTPYLLVGKAPSFEDYDTRHQLLLNFGVSILIFFAITRLVKSKHHMMVFCIFLFLLSSVHVSLQFKQMRRWLSQEIIMHYIKENNSLSSKVIYVEYKKDRRDDYFSNFRFYELNGMYKLIKGKEDKLFIDENFVAGKLGKSNLSQFVKFRIENHALTNCNMKDFTPDGTCSTMIMQFEYRNNYFKIMRDVLHYYTNRNSFYLNSDDYVKISFESKAPEAVLPLMN